MLTKTQRDRFERIVIYIAKMVKYDYELMSENTIATLAASILLVATQVFE